MLCFDSIQFILFLNFVCFGKRILLLELNYFISFKSFEKIKIILREKLKFYKSQDNILQFFTDQF